MTTSGDETKQNIDETIERILGSASVRAAPSAEEAEAVRRSVHAEWRNLTKVRKARRRLASFAIAASVIVAVVVAFSSLRTVDVNNFVVASIGKSFGSIYVLGESSELLAGNHLQAITSGQVLITAADSGVALRWGSGGSLRVDADTRLEFFGSDSVFLHSGRVYFDSRPDTFASGVSPAESSGLTIQTLLGSVMHVGTQFMAQAADMSLIVSVREGEAIMDTGARTTSAYAGQQLQRYGRGETTQVDINTYGGDWAWTERLSPSIAANGDRTIDEFLGWVGRETGLNVSYATPAAEKHAAEKKLRGKLDSDPLSELQAWMLTADLDWHIEAGTISIRHVGEQAAE